MRFRKAMLAAAMAALVMATSLLGASTAGAAETALCGSDKVPCGSPVSHIHKVGTTGFSFIFEIGCTWLLLADVLNPLRGKPLHIISVSSFTLCEDDKGGKCEVKELSGPSLDELLKIASEKAKVTGEGELLLKCGSFVHCVYNGAGLEGEFLGALLAGGTGELRYTEQTLNKVSGFLCPETTKLNASAKPLTATYVSS